MQEQVRVILLVGALATVALRVGHSGADDDVIALGVTHELEVALVVAGAVGLVDIVRDRVQHTDGVEPGAALKAGPGDLPHSALHAVFHHQVFGRTHDMQESVDGRINQL